MIEQHYSKDTSHAYQTLITNIHATKTEVFRLLATTDGISSWFPQLSINKEKDEQFVLFDMGDNTFEKMSLLDFATNEHIAFEWATGKVEFQLEEGHEETCLTLKEALPLDFKAIPQDFTGWYVQMKNIKNVLETGSVDKLDPSEIKKVREQIKEKLFEN